MIIAIDGPAGSGKSTTAKLLAKKIGFIYLDTGAMYRAVTHYFLNNLADLTNSSEILQLLNEMNLKIDHQNDEFTVFLDNKNVNSHIRKQNINQFVSDVSKIGEVRKEMVEIQRNFSNKKDIVVEGRDIGSHVFPNADYKFFIKADIRLISQSGQNFEWDIALKEGKNREIKRIFSNFDVEVILLHRYYFSGIELKNINSGKYRKLSKEEMKKLIK